MSFSRVQVWGLGSAVSVSVGLGVAIAAAGQGLSFENWWGTSYGPRTQADSASAAVAARAGAQPSGADDRLRHWNSVAIGATGLDHTPEGVGAAHTFGHQLGPGRASRAMAMVHVAMFEAVNAVDRRYESYLGIRADRGASMEAAIAQAAHDTLNALYPSQAAQCDLVLADDLRQMPAGKAKQAGIALGRSIANAILRRRSGDGSAHAESLVGVDYIPGTAPGEWRQDPISRIPVALGVKWGSVTPFVVGSVQAFRVPPPPALNSREYAEAFNEVKRLGGDGADTPTRRSDDQTIAGIYWAYDGTPALCAPPRLYNQIAMAIADLRGSDVAERARLLALVNVAMADAAIAIWESKYFYKFWRPVTGIREADEGTGPTGDGDRNHLTFGDPAFSPLAAPASNLGGTSVEPPNFTPPFPSYPSGHAGFGGALFQTLRNVYGTDDIAFTFVSDELNGVTLDNKGNPRPLMPRSFDSLSQAEEENGQSRIYLGIHWSFDKTEGIAQGRRVADYVFAHAFKPLKANAGE
jgi:hypothetical protein